MAKMTDENERKYHKHFRNCLCLKHFRVFMEIFDEFRIF